MKTRTAILQNDLTLKFIKDWALTVQLLPAPSSSQMPCVQYRSGQGNAQWESLIKSRAHLQCHEDGGDEDGESKSSTQWSHQTTYCSLVFSLKTKLLWMQNQTVHHQYFDQWFNETQPARKKHIYTYWLLNNYPRWKQMRVEVGVGRVTGKGGFSLLFCSSFYVFSEWHVLVHTNLMACHF